MTKRTHDRVSATRESVEIARRNKQRRQQAVFNLSGAKKLRYEISELKRHLTAVEYDLKQDAHKDNMLLISKQKSLARQIQEMQDTVVHLEKNENKQ